MYTLGKQTGYSNRLTNNYWSILDYVPSSPLGYSANVVNNYSGILDYIEFRDYYSCTLIDIQPPVTWDIWAVNWENIDTNWNNEVYN